MADLEVEVKYRVDDFSVLEEALNRLGAQRKETQEEADLYFNHPARDFAETDEAVRIRSIGQRNQLTYKGPKTDLLTKTRREVEVSLAEGSTTQSEMREWLELVGFRSVVEVRKQRTLYTLPWNDRSFLITLDDVPEVGRFSEIETITPESGFEKARADLLSLAEALGLDQSDSERRSYLELLLEARS